MKNLSYILLLATLLVSCSDTGKTESEQSVTADSTKVDSDALAYVKINGKYGYINPKGEFVITLQSDGTWDFSK